MKLMINHSNSFNFLKQSLFAVMLIDLYLQCDPKNVTLLFFE